MHAVCISAKLFNNYEDALLLPVFVTCVNVCAIKTLN